MLLCHLVRQYTNSWEPNRADFEVIQIVEDADPYPGLLGLDWAINMGGIINLKKRSMVFENNGTRVIIPLNPAKGEQYIEPVCDEEDVDHIYKLTARDEDWINPMAEGVLCWERTTNVSPTLMGKWIIGKKIYMMSLR